MAREATTPTASLGHDDILKLATSFLSERHLLRLLVGQQFPFIFVDESRDTMPSASMLSPIGIRS
jgi:hypothetical protein